MANERIVTGVPSKDSAPPPSPRTFTGFSEITSFLWSVADLLRGDYKQADYGKVILPLTVKYYRLDKISEGNQIMLSIAEPVAIRGRRSAPVRPGTSRRPCPRSSTS